jgi:hypothetical protein
MLRTLLAASVVLVPVAFVFGAPPVLANPTLPTATVTSKVPLPPKPIEAQLAPFLEAKFDDVPLGIVDTAYQAKGITFACVGTGCASPHAYAALANPLVTAAQNHVVSPFAGNIMPFFDDRSGAIQATFNKACTSVSVLVQVLAGAEGFTPGNRPYVKAFAANGQQVGATTYGSPPGVSDGGPPPWQQLNVNTTAAAPIASMRFGVEHASGMSVQGIFDSVVCTY